MGCDPSKCFVDVDWLKCAVLSDSNIQYSFIYLANKLRGLGDSLSLRGVFGESVKPRHTPRNPDKPRVNGTHRWAC